MAKDKTGQYKQQFTQNLEEDILYSSFSLGFYMCVFVCVHEKTKERDHTIKKIELQHIWVLFKVINSIWW